MTSAKALTSGLLISTLSAVTVLGPVAAAGEPAVPQAEAPAPVAPAATPSDGPVHTEAADAPQATESQAGIPQPPPAGTPGQEEVPLVSVEGVSIFGREFMQDTQTGVLTVTGSPRVVTASEEISADRLVIDLANNQIVAEGNVVIRQGPQVIRASRATYNLEERAGEAENAVGTFETIALEADQLLLQPGPIYQARRVRFTTCDPEDPHYQLYARTLQLEPGRRVQGRGLGLDLAGRRIVTVPRFSRRLDQEEERRALYPSLGYSRRTGPYLEQDFRLRRQAPVFLDAHARVNLGFEPSLGVLAATPGSPQIVAALYYRDTAENQRVPQLQVSRLPEVGIVWTPRAEVRPGRFLPNMVSGVRRPSYLAESREWRLSGQVTAGFLRQHRGIHTRLPNSESKDAFRFGAQVQGVLPHLVLGPVDFSDLRFLVRQNLYDTGDEQTVFGLGLGKELRTGNWRFRIDRFDQFRRGESPFLMDSLELRQEWRPRLTFQSPGFHFAYFARIRARDGSLFDQGFSISKRFHCLEPRLTYRVRRSEIGFDIRIPGLSGFRGAGGRSPQTVDTPDVLGEDLEPPQ